MCASDTFPKFHFLPFMIHLNNNLTMLRVKNYKNELYVLVSLHRSVLRKKGLERCINMLLE